MQDVEKELEVQIGMKQEMELSMKMLEKDVCEKQDALVELRQQLEDLRAINQQLMHKSQVRRCFSCLIMRTLLLKGAHPLLSLFTRRFQLFPGTCRCLISLLALCEMIKHHYLSRITYSQQ